MPEPTTTQTGTDKSDVPVRHGCIDEHTCACGEKHEPHTGTVSHRESCTSPLKYGDTCCCRSPDDAKNASHLCGHGPRCQ